jgi:hypothetical protein
LWVFLGSLVAHHEHMCSVLHQVRYSSFNRLQTFRLRVVFYLLRFTVQEGCFGELVFIKTMQIQLSFVA